MIKHVVFDVAHTLLDKPLLYRSIGEALKTHGYSVDEKTIRQKHKFLTEKFRFPNKTGKDFYRLFNRAFCRALGIEAENSLIEDIYYAALKIPWEPFSDTEVLKDISLPKGILSNWDNTLHDKLKMTFPGVYFEFVLVSSDTGMAKPHEAFFHKMIAACGVLPKEILYIGDSPELDIYPALKAGIQALLIDRHDVFGDFKGDRITNLEEILPLIKI